MLDLLPRLKRLIEMIVIPQLILRGGRPAWSTAVGLGPIPYRFAGSNPAPRTTFCQKLGKVEKAFYSAIQQLCLEQFAGLNWYNLIV